MSGIFEMFISDIQLLLLLFEFKIDIYIIIPLFMGNE